MRINATTKEEFAEQFRNYLNQDKSRSLCNIVYKWKVENDIPRMKGESNILYIGQTKRSLYDRYSDKGSFNIELTYFEQFYKYAIQEYGSLFIEILAVDDVKLEEYRELDHYRSMHCEYPPLNRAIPKKPKNKDSIHK